MTVKEIFLVMVMLFGVSGAVNAQTNEYQRPCGAGVDLCTWDTVLPLGYPVGDIWGCNYHQNTYWAPNTDARVTCTFDGDDYEEYVLYLSIDNDIINCTLNGNVVMPYKAHEGCAPADPRNGYNVTLSPASGQNTLVCNVRDRGGIDHFDSCVVGNGPITPTPEFSSIVVPALVLLLTPTLAYFAVRRFRK